MSTPWKTLLTVAMLVGASWLTIAFVACNSEPPSSSPPSGQTSRASSDIQACKVALGLRELTVDETVRDILRADNYDQRADGADVMENLDQLGEALSDYRDGRITQGELDEVIGDLEVALGLYILKYCGPELDADKRARPWYYE